MPKTKFQGFIFTLMTAILMAYLMIVYNIYLTSNNLTNKTFLIALKKYPIELIIVFILAYLVASPLAKRKAFRVVNPKSDNKMLVILTIQTFTVCIMVPLMSIYALFIQNLVNSNVIGNFLILLCQNFKMAYPLQILVVGPLVRSIFRFIFKKYL